MNRTTRFFVGFALFLSCTDVSLQGQTTLNAGDLVFTGYNADFPGSSSTDGGQFSFLTLRDLDAGTTIFLTDFGWNADVSAFHTASVTNDAVIEWTTSTALSCGTEVVISATSTNSATADVGTVVSGGLTFNSSGDQISAFQGTFVSPNFIAALQAEAGAYLLTAPTNDRGSQLPDGLTEGTSTFVISTEIDNMTYNGPVINESAENIRTAIHDNANWITNNSAPFTLSNINWTISDCLGGVSDSDVPVLATLTLSGSPSLNETSITFSASFDEAVVGVSVDDFSLAVTGSATGVIGVPRTVDGINFSVSVSNLAGTGTLRLDLNASTDIVDAAGNGNGTNGFVAAKTGDNIHSVDVEEPTVSSINVSGSPGSESTSISFDVTFSESVTGVDLSDFALDLNGVTAVLASVSGSGATYNVEVGSIIGTGTVSIDLVTDGSIADAAGNNLNAGFTAGDTHSADVPLPPVGGSTLATGDLVFTGYNADFPGTASTDGGQFSFLLLRDIDAGTTIYFTDFGWDASLNAFHTPSVTNDAVVEWTATSAISCGTEIVITATSITAATANQGVVISGGFTFNSSGDQISAYQGTFNSPDFVTALQAEAGAYSASAPTNDRGSQLPNGLVEGTSAFVIVPETDNMVYSGAVTNDTAENIRSAIYDNTNWTTDNSIPRTLSTIAWNVTVCLSAGDSISPELTVGNITVDNDAGICGAVVGSFGASATDDSGTADLTFDIAEGAQFAVGTTTVTATATDPSGNAAQATFDVTVNDVEAPVLSLNGDATIDLNEGETYSELGAAATDNCVDPTVVIGGDVVDTNTPGTYVVTYDATDAAGNVAVQITRTVNVILVDTEGPVITVNDINLDSEAGECGTNIFDYGAIATDDSGIADFNFSIPEGSFFDPGTTEVIAFASDNLGNVSQVTFNVTINDIEAPVLVTQGITVELDENGFAELPPLNPEVILFQGTFDDDTPTQNTNSLVNWNVTGGNVDVYFANQFGSPFNDNALELAGSVNGAIESKETFTLEPGNYLFSFEARGFNGDAAIGIDIGNVLNTSFEEFTGSRQTVIFEFTVTQTITATIRLNEFGGGDAFSGTLLDNLLLQKLADSILISATDNCGVTEITPSVTGFGCNELGTQQVTLTVRDEAGNEASETVDVEVVDNLAPTFATRESFIIFVDENGEASVTPDDYNRDTVLDNCGVDRIEFDRTEFGCGDVGFHVINVTAFDASGNTTTTQADVEVRDEIAPVFLTQESFIIFLDANGNASLTPDQYNTATIQTNCNLDRVEFSRTDFGCGDVGFFTIDVTAFDNNGLATTTQADVEVRDEISPVITIIGDVLKEVDLGSPYFEEGANVVDNCDAPLVIGGGVDVNTVGTYIITYNAVDENGNPATEVIRTVNVIQVDVTGPVITVSDINIDSEPGECGANIFDYGATATDESGIADFNFSIAEGSFFDPGTTEVIAFASDNFGNVSQVTFNITINDIEAPVLVARGITVELDENGFAELPSLNPEVILFQGTFDDDTPAQNTNSLVNWNVTGGNVDVYFANQFGSPFNDNALELAGSVNGAIESKEAFTLEPGNYLFSFEARGFNGDAAIGIDIGTVLNTSFEDFNGSRETVVFEFTVTQTTTATIRLNEFGGGDAFSGTLLDNMLLQKLADSILITATDNCGITEITPSVTGFGCNELGTQQVTLTVRDEAGNETSETVDVQVVDNLAPTFATRESFILLLDANGQASVTPDEYNRDTVLDNCGVDRIEFDRTEFGCGDVGFHVINVTAIDASGNTTTTQADVEVRDEIAPVFLTRESFIIFVDENGVASITPDQYNTETIVTNCDLDRIEFDRTEFGCADVGFHVISVTAFDGNGLATTTQADVEVRDEIAPTFLTRESFIIFVDENGVASITPDQYNAETIVTNCDLDRIEFDRTEFGCGDVGFHVINVTAFDGNGLATTTQADVEVRDEIAPIFLTRESFILDLDENGQATLTPDQYNRETIQTNCDLDRVEFDRTVFGCGDLGFFTINVTAFDGNGLATTTEADVEVRDAIGPVARAKDITVTLDEAGNATITAEDINDGSTDNCGIESFSIDRTVFDCDDIGEQNIVTLTVIDSNGISAQAQATVTVSDITAPVLEVQDITLALDANGQASLPALTAQTQIFYDGFAADDPALAKTELVNWNVLVGDVDVFFPNQFGLPFSTSALDVAGDVNGAIESKESFLFEPGDYRLTFTVLGNNDDARLELEIGSLVGTTFTEFIGGTIETRSVDFTVTSTTSATIVFSEFGDEPFFSGTTIDDIELSRLGEELVTFADDACGVTTITAGQTIFDCSDLGTQAVTITATDANGNTSSATATVTIVDTNAPNVVAQDITVALGASGEVTISAQDINGSTTDNCDFTLSIDETIFNCASLGENTVTLTATDGSGNAASANATVTVVDNVGPVVNGVSVEVNLDENGNASISLADVEGAISDNCGVATITIEATNFTCDNLGANSVNVTATDTNGNSTTGSIIVNVIDIIPPVVFTEDIALSLDENGQAVITADDVLILSEDEIDSGEECTVSAAEHHAVWLSQYVAKRGNQGGDDDDDDDDWKRARSSNDLDMHRGGRGKGKGRGRGHDDDDDDDDHYRAENTRFIFDANGGSLSRNVDGTATVTGTIRSTAKANDQWVVSLNLENARSWDEWSALGRSYKDEAGLAHRRFEDWTYYEMAAGSKLVGAGVNEGEEIALTHAPSDFRFGFQLGDAANSKNGNFGLSGWFFYTNKKGKTVQGDFNLDVTDCTPNTPPSEVGVTADNCSLGDITLSQSIFTCSDIGENQVEITVADESGNETTAYATVTISDDIAPVALAQDITVSLGANGTVTISPQDLDGGSTDNCAIVSYSLSQNTFSCDDVSDNNHYYGYYWWWKKQNKQGQQVTLTVTDAAGNTSSAEAYVTVVDDTAPVISQEPVTIVVFGNRKERLRYADVASRVTDNCGIKWIDFPWKRYSRRDAGMNTVMVSAKDKSGNRTTGLLNVEVIDISNYGNRVEICYNGQTRRVGKGSVQTWLRKGASLGSCGTDLQMNAGGTNLNGALGGERIVEPLIELGAYPNPTQDETVIKFSSDVAGPASVGVISPNGVRLAVLFDSDIVANENTEVRYNTSQLPSGIYIVRLVTAGEVRNLKLMVKK